MAYTKRPWQHFYFRKILIGDECWIWTGGNDGNGYGRTHSDGVEVYCHRLAYEKFIGPIPAGMHVLHKCDNPSCSNPSHLFLGKQRENNRDAMSKLRSVHFGKKWSGPRKEWMAKSTLVRHSSKLNPDLVHSIRKSYSTGEFTYDTLAEKYGLPRTLIQSALNKWKNLETRVCQS